MFRTLGAGVYRRRWWVIGAWLVIAVIGIMAGGPLNERVTAEFTGSERIEAARVLERINETAPTGGDIAIIVDGVTVDADGDGIIDDDDRPSEVADVLAAVAAVDGVVSVVDPWGAGAVAPQLTATDGVAAPGGRLLRQRARARGRGGVG